MKLPVVCPSCESTLIVSQMKCTNCDTTVNGNYELPCIFSLVVRNNNLSLIFLSSGSIKEMSKQANLSYPTMRNKMDDLIEKISELKRLYPKFVIICKSIYNQID